MTPKTIAATMIGSLALAACADTTLTEENADYNRVLQDYPDMSPVEFSLLDTNNDGMLNPVELQAIGEDGIDTIEVDDDN